MNIELLPYAGKQILIDEIEQVERDIRFLVELIQEGEQQTARIERFRKLYEYQSQIIAELFKRVP